MVFLTLILGIHGGQQSVVITLDLILFAEHRGLPSGGVAPGVLVEGNRLRLRPLSAMVGPARFDQMPARASQRFVYDMARSGQAQTARSNKRRPSRARKCTG
jgi:hypothetical protein